MKALINVDGFVELTGMSKSWVYKHAAQELPVVRIGRRVMFRAEDVEAFVQRKLKVHTDAPTNTTSVETNADNATEIQR